MADQATIARPYAKALFETASSAQAVAPWHDVLCALSAVVANNQVADLLKDPNVVPGRWQVFFIEMINELAKDAANKLSESGLNNFLQLLLDESRLSALPEIYRLYREQQLLAENKLDVDVLSVTALSAEQKNHLHKKLEARFGMQVSMYFKQHPDLIGGLVIQSEKGVIDCSIRGALNKLATHLKKEVDNL